MSAAVHRLHDGALANTSYLIEVGDGAAIVVDPPRDIDHHVGLANRLDVEIVAAFETHVHADYVSGATEFLARGVRVVVPVGAEPVWAHQSVADDQRLELGRVAVRVVATPGHTPEHVTYVVEEGGSPVGAFTGGSLILGGAARTDLLGSERTVELAQDQFASLQRLKRLPDDTNLYPTHGAGSFCLATGTSVANPTIGSERRANPLLALEDRDDFVGALTAGFGTYPTYYRHLQALNTVGPPPLASLGEIPALDPAEVARRMGGGAWLIDARPIAEWAVGHPRGAISNELRPAFASWLGWVVPFGAPVILLLESDRLPDAERLARRIGYDDLALLDGGVDAWRDAGLAIDTTEALTPEEAKRRWEQGTLLVDVRQEAELDALRIPGAVHLEVGDIVAGSVPDATRVITFCGHGERSATAASLLERHGIEVANLVGGTSAWTEAGLPVER